MPCYTDGKGSWICTGSGTRYQARTRYRGCRNYNLIGKPTRSYRVAILRMAKEFAESTGHTKRADVIMWADYYDPVQMCELVRK